MSFTRTSPPTDTRKAQNLPRIESNEEARIQNSEPASETLWLIGIAALLIVVSLVAVSGESFWIDEFTTTHFANQPSLRAMWQEMFRLKWPELQAPFYMAYIWVWQHLFGTGEWVSRLAGVPWFVLGATLFVSSLRAPFERTTALLVVAFNPFTWFYLNEARLYSTELGLTYIAMAALVRLQRTAANQQPFEIHWLVLLCLSIWLLSVLTVLGMVWVGALCFILPAFFSTRWLREHWVSLATTALALVPCAGYYLWTRSLGTRAAAFGGGGWRNLVFVFYEQLGFNGLGPGRLALRESGLAAIVAWLPLLAFFAAALGIVSFAGFRQLTQSRNLKAALLTVSGLALPMTFLVTIGLIMNFRLLGRHCTPMVAVIVFLLTLGTTHLWQQKLWWTRLSCFTFLGLSLLSCLSQRFASRHAKDDYRSAAKIAKAALENGKSVWWNADSFSCDYYRLSCSRDRPSPGSVWTLMNPMTGFEKGIAPPDLIIVSKPDTYDSLGSVHRFCKKEAYIPRQILPAFVIFERPG